MAIENFTTPQIFIISLLQISYRICQWKNCENRLKFFYAVTAMSLVSPFLGDTVYSLGLYGTQQVRLYPCCRFMLDVIVDARVHALWQLPASLYSVV